MNHNCEIMNHELNNNVIQKIMELVLPLLAN